MRVLTFTGWCQSPDALDPLAKALGATEVMHEDYQARAPGPSEPKSADLVIAWSLGGVVAMQMLLQGLLNTQTLLMLGAPYRFKGEGGQPPEQCDTFQSHFQAAPEKLLSFFSGWAQEGGPTKQPLASHRTPHSAAWLEYLMQPLTWENNEHAQSTRLMFVHGKQDQVVPVAQTMRWSASFPRSVVAVLDGCGHTPHLHATASIQSVYHVNA